MNENFGYLPKEAKIEALESEAIKIFDCLSTAIKDKATEDQFHKTIELLNQPVQRRSFIQKKP